MSGPPKTRAWLAAELAKKLAWDPLMTNSLLDTVCGKSSRSEIDDVVQNFLAGEEAAISVVNQYLASQPGAAGSSQAVQGPDSTWRQYSKEASPSGLPDYATSSKKAQPGSTKKDASEAATAADRQQQQQPAKVLGMFKQGGRIRSGPTPAAAGGAGGSGSGVRVQAGRRDDQAAQLERKVVNCLGCGKIYDCRTVTNDVMRFLEKGGICTFCGDKVALTYGDRAEQAAATEAASVPAATDAATVAAVAFKDRLVEYDRNSAKRTNVIDDQSDYFEIDTNAWLSDQERAELRRRRKLEEEAEAAKKKRVTVTIDLIGRKVIVPDSSDPSCGFETSATMAEARAEVAAAAAASAAAAQAAAAAYAGPSAASKPPVATAQQVSQAVAALREMKMTINPHLASSSAPVFLPSAQAQAKPLGRTAPSGAAAGSRTGPAGQRQGRGKAADGAAAVPSLLRNQGNRQQRLQGDLFEEFDEFGLGVVYDDIMAAAAAADARPFDLCPPEFAGLQRLPHPTLAHKLQALSLPQAPAPTPLPKGMALLRGFLTIQAQAALVTELRALGQGPGGFYTPSYKDGGQLHLRMMCLGRHWEPRTHSYEALRFAHDGATPPPLPASLAALAAAVVAAANQQSGYTQPGPFEPDVCLVNFYEGKGKLGYHQDKDEGSESLRRGLPVVSVSIGDAADFIFGTSPNEAEASCVRLESGDALVFGGPARMVYHAVPRIHPGTAPEALLEATGLRPGRLNLTIRQV